jgi:hypothetical protein
MAVQGILATLSHGSYGAPTTLVDYTAYVRSGGVDENLGEHEASVWGTAGIHDYEVGFNSATMPVTYKYHATIYDILRDIKTNRTAVNYSYGIVGDTTGDPSKTGSMVMTGFSHTQAPDGGILEINVTWRLKSIVEGDFA